MTDITTSKWSERRAAWLTQVEADRPAVTPYIFKVAWFMAADVHSKTHEWHVGITRLAKKLGKPQAVRYALARLEERGHIQKLDVSGGMVAHQPYRLVIRQTAGAAR